MTDEFGCRLTTVKALINFATENLNKNGYDILANSLATESNKFFLELDEMLEGE